ncbi:MULTISPECIES: FAD-dependent oxidoreductase [unclassified Arthrobacter]|uniref:FAD-dependent oxidoreductase n=1 Tax=unclassified Arthrobacter TaxID=235627 RepID=UPI001E526FD9|nr:MULTISPECIES: FAD-dependent oxidoreductase [unclassified Arthrobacter]MCC9145186.1 FAD-dependent oxidoreductase [Arthrobacter sp. zg-Y919]MDK1276414.1 FAD-dependent oxidoreductase [Arthrobacter sp. zg.Y919]WIB01986.1 FAD-dependent oxidoreductase [Arthrobacter sp. zg-Y919]
MNTELSQLPVAVIGSGPVGLAAAAHLLERGLTPVIFEAGDAPASAVRAWGHVRLFSPWQYDVDAAARRLLTGTGWQEPDADTLPTGAELLEQYLLPLAAVPAIRSALHTNSEVVAVSREGLDKTHTGGRDTTPFLVRVRNSDGTTADHRVRAVIDASGTWNTPNPLGTAGLAAPGEAEAYGEGFITAPLPDVTGRERARFAGKHVLVVGAGHSAANTLLALGELAEQEPDTRISWAIRRSSAAGVYGGGDLDGLPARGALGSRLRTLVEDGRIELHTSFTITGFKSADSLTVVATTPCGETQLDVDLLVPATGFRPNLDMLREVRLDLDPAVEAPRALGPLIDPEFHSCGTVTPHGARMLSHPDKDFYITGMKSYGRAPTFLMATGYEQVRSIAAALAGDQQAADDVQLVLPETGVCSTDLGGSCDTVAGCDADGAADQGEVSCCGTPEPAAAAVAAADSCCGSPAPEPAALEAASCCGAPEAEAAPAADSCCAAPEPAFLGIPTDLEHGRSSEQGN